MRFFPETKVSLDIIIVISAIGKMSSSPSEDKVRANRGQKRNFSFESHPTSTTCAAGKEPPVSSSSLFMQSVAESGRFDIAAIVAKMDIGVGMSSGNTRPGNIAEESTSDQVRGQLWVHVAHPNYVVVSKDMSILS